MSVSELTITNLRPKQISIYRVLGTIGMICAPALYLGTFFSAGHMRGGANPDQIFASILGVLYLSGAAASAVAMRRLRVTGKGTGAAILFYVQISGLLLAMTWDVFEYAATPQLRESALYFVADMSYPFSHVLMNVVGIAAWQARIWKGWRLAPSFLCGLALPLFFLSSALIGWENSGWVFLSGTIAGFFLLGLAIQTTKLSPQAQE